MDRSLALAILIVGRGAITKSHLPDNPFPEVSSSLPLSLFEELKDPEYWDCKASSYWRHKEVPMSKRNSSNHPMATMPSRTELTFAEPNEREPS